VKNLKAQVASASRSVLAKVVKPVADDSANKSIPSPSTKTQVEVVEQEEVVPVTEVDDKVHEEEEAREDAEVSLLRAQLEEAQRSSRSDAEVGRIMNEFEERGQILSDVQSQLEGALEQGRRWLELLGGEEAAEMLSNLPSNPIPADMAPEALRTLLEIMHAQLEAEKRKIAKLKEAAAAGVDPEKMRELIDREVEQVRTPLIGKIDALTAMRDQQEVELVMLREEVRDMMRNGADLDEAREARFAVQRLKRVQDALEKSAAGNARRLEGMLESARAEADKANAMYKQASQKLDATTDALNDAEERENRMRREMVAATYKQLKQLRTEMTAAHSSRLRELSHLIFLRDKQLEAALYGSYSSEGGAADVEAAQHSERFWANEGLSPGAAEKGKGAGAISAARPSTGTGTRPSTGVTQINNMVRGIEPRPRPSTGAAKPQRLARVKSASVLPSFESASRVTSHHEMRTRSTSEFGPHACPHPITGKVPARRGTLDLRPVAVQDLADESNFLITHNRPGAFLPSTVPEPPRASPNKPPRVQSANHHGSHGQRADGHPRPATPVSPSTHRKFDFPKRPPSGWRDSHGGGGTAAVSTVADAYA